MARQADGSPVAVCAHCQNTQRTCPDLDESGAFYCLSVRRWLRSPSGVKNWSCPECGKDWWKLIGATCPRGGRHLFPMLRAAPCLAHSVAPAPEIPQERAHMFHARLGDIQGQLNAAAQQLDSLVSLIEAIIRQVRDMQIEFARIQAYQLSV